jgi:spore germination protein KB
MERISQLQWILLMSLFFAGTAIAFVISPLSSAAGFSGWICILLGAGGGLLIAWPAVKLGGLQPGRFFIDFGKELVGKWVHVPLALILWLYVIHLCSLTLREFSDFLIQSYLPTTPMWAIAGIFGFCIAIAARSGLEAIFRCGSGFFFVVTISMFISLIFVSKELIWPMSIALIKDMNAAGIWNGTLLQMSRFADVFLVLLIYPCMKNQNKTYRSSGIAVYLAATINALFYVFCILLFGPDLTGQLTYPALELIRYMRIGDFLENLDPIMVAIWMTNVFLKLSFLLYLAVLLMSQLTGLKSTRPFAFSIGALVVGLSIHISVSYADFNEFRVHAWPAMSFLVQCIPLIYWGGYYIRRNKLPHYRQQ